MVLFIEWACGKQSCRISFIILTSCVAAFATVGFRGKGQMQAVIVLEMLVRRTTCMIPASELGLLGPSSYVEGR